MAMLKALPKEVSAKGGGPVRRALRKGALVIHAQAKINLGQRLDDTSTGLLSDSVVVTRGRALASGNGEKYLIRVKRKIYPRQSGKPVSTRATAQWLEYGREAQPAEPWLRPAFAAKRAQAVDVTITTLRADIDRLVKKLSRGRLK